MNRLMRHMGQEVVIHGRDGRSFRGIMDGFDPPRRGVFIRDEFRRRRRFIPFFLIAAIFARRRRIF
jgi:hypothetical protein